MIRIGYQGMKGSFSEIAAILIAEEMGEKEYTLVPLMTSRNVVKELISKSIEYGVMAIENTIGGIVEETKIELEGVSVEEILRKQILIQQCLFKKDLNVNTEEIVKVASHIQGLRQTSGNVRRILGKVEEQPIEDTAIGAMRLSGGAMEPTTAIICRKETGLMYGLEIIEEDVQDDKENYTTFGMYKLR